MGFTQEQKIDFIFDVALNLAKKENLISFKEFLMAEYDISETDMENVSDALIDVDEKSAKGINVSYVEFEQAIRKGGFDIFKAKCIIGILYADSQFTDVIESWDSPSLEIKSFMQKAEKYQRNYNLNDID